MLQSIHNKFFAVVQPRVVSRGRVVSGRLQQTRNIKFQAKNLVKKSTFRGFRSDIVCKASVAEASQKDDVELVDDILKWDKAPEEKCTIDNNVVSDTLLKTTVTIPPNIVKWVENCTFEYLNDILRDSPSEIPTGFRPGKVPRSQLEYKFGKKMVHQQIVVCLTHSCFDQIKETAPENVIGDTLRIVDQESLYKLFEYGKEFKFDIEMDLQPSIKWLQDYKSLKIQVPNISSVVNFEREADKFIRGKLKEDGKLVAVTDRGVNLDDVLMMSYEAERADNGEKIPGMKRDNFQHDLEEQLLPGFAENLVGRYKGEELGFELVFPQEWDPPQMRGVNLRFKVNIHEIFQYELPQIDVELCTKISGGVCEEPEKLREYFAGEFQNRVDMDQMNLVLEELGKVFSDAVELQIPEQFLYQSALRQYQGKLFQAMEKNQLSKQVMEQLMTEQMVEDYYTKNRKSIEDALKADYAIDDILEKEDLKVPEEEVRERVKQLEPELKRRNLNLNNFLETELLNAKLYTVYDHLRSLGVVELI